MKQQGEEKEKTGNNKSMFTLTYGQPSSAMKAGIEK